MALDVNDFDPAGTGSERCPACGGATIAHGSDELTLRHPVTRAPIMVELVVAWCVDCGASAAGVV